MARLGWIVLAVAGFALVSAVMAAALVPAARDVAKEHLRRVLFAGMPVPHPAGEFAVGLRTLAADTDGVSIPFDVWYPAAPEDRGAAGQLAEVASFLAHPTRAPGRPDAPVAEGASRTLILYGAAGGAPRSDNSYLLAELASRGYVVAALDDLALQPLPAAAADREAVLSSLDYSGEAALTESMTLADRRVEVGVRRWRAVADQLATESPWREAIDFDSFAVMGTSFGGTIAEALAAADKRVGAVVDIDGSTYGPASRKAADVPLLYVFGDSAFMPTSALASDSLQMRSDAKLVVLEMDRLLASATPDGQLAVALPEVAHVELGDRLVRPTFASFGRTDDRDRLQLWRGLSSLIVGFLDSAMRGGGQVDVPAGALPDGVVSLAEVVAGAAARDSLAPAKHVSHTEGRPHG